MAVTYQTEGVKMPDIKKRETTEWIKSVAATYGKKVGESLDTVKTNSEQFKTTYDEELHRIIIHGILHLCGINDKGPGEREIMEAAENRALEIRK